MSTEQEGVDLKKMITKYRLFKMEIRIVIKNHLIISMVFYRTANNHCCVVEGVYSCCPLLSAQTTQRSVL